MTEPEIGLRVVIIADYAISEGGAPQVAIASAIGLADLGHEVTYIHGVGEEGSAALDAQPRIRRISLGGQDIWNKNIVAGAKDGIWNVEYHPRLISILAEFDPRYTVVHVHQWTKYFSPSVFSAVRKSGLPLVVSLHDYFLSCPTGLMYRFDKQAPCTVKPLSMSCLAAPCDPRTSLHKAIRVMRSVATNRTLGAHPFTAIHVSEIGRRTIGHFLPAGARQVVLENPVECMDTGLRKAGKTLKLAYCGRLTEEKGADLVATVARKLGIPSLFIGEGPLKERIREIDPDAEITGWLDKSAVRARIEKDVLAVVAPSRWPETGPLVIAEALSCGVPVIVSERAGAAGRIEHGKNGFAVAPDVEAISSVVTALQSPGTAAALGEAGYRSFWAAPPSLRAHASKLADVYRSALSEVS
jgi:glycosyltransferase involved in cell wall biosynthesis